MLMSLTKMKAEIRRRQELALLAVLAWFRVGGESAPTVVASGWGLLWAVVAGGFLAGAGLGARLLMARVLAHTVSRDPLRFVGAYLAALSMAFTMRLLCAVVGFMYALRVGDPWWSLAASAAALVAMGKGWPKRSDFVALTAAGKAPKPG
ncbi:hypothetical protein IIA16_02370 [bacterium]|nr:hypothetical protein [bacterium]